MLEKTEQGTETEMCRKRRKRHGDRNIRNDGKGMETEIGNDRKGTETELSKMTEQKEECQNMESENAWSITGHNGQIYEF